MATRALVLGGGGPVGVAWESGLAAGLAEEGIVLAESEIIIGTSAGSIVGSQLALGRPAQELLAVQLALSEGDRPAQRLLQQVDTRALIDHFAGLFASGMPREEMLKQLGALALSAKTASEQEWLGTFGSAHRLEKWPERRFICTAIDTADGSFVTWDKQSGVALGLAVASSCAVPGVFPPVTINGRRYMDGGMRSSTNADLARGYDKVLVVSVTGSGAMAMRGPYALRARERLERELGGLRESGSAVELVVPDVASLEAFGPNLLDPSGRGEIAEAGLRQGRAEAARLRAFWS